VNRERLIDLINYPWIYGPRWRRAYRFAAIRDRGLAQEHITWALALKERVADRNTPREEGE
jgi:hypothetical protein